MQKFGTEHFYDSDEYYSPYEDCIVETDSKEKFNDNQTDKSNTPEGLPSEETSEDGPSTRVARQKTKPTWLKDYIVYSINN